MNENILITGGAGFIGSYTANALIDKGYDVTVFDNLSSQVHPDPEASLSRLSPKVKFIKGDVRNHGEMEKAIDGIDVIYHFAAETGVGQSMYEIERYTDVTIQGTAVLCECLAKSKNRAKKVVLSSSRAVYGEGTYLCKLCGNVSPDPRTLDQLQNGIWDPVCPGCHNKIVPLPCKETASQKPTSFYGLTKKVQEDLLKMMSDTYHIPVIIFRYFNVFGPGQALSNPYTGVLTIFTSLLLAGKEIEIYEDGHMQRDFVPVREIISANLKALEIEQLGTVTCNVGTGVQKTILELAETLKKETKSSSNMTFSNRYRAGDIRHCYADMSKASQFIDIPSEDNFYQEIKDLVLWIKEGKVEIDLPKSIDELSRFGLTNKAKQNNL
ncbi:MAG: SDR family NAD(P)-dependent oxidoreductase [Candidatus Aureabacteria bacterium]|nr:SDR family NAD(P)-dependent oxidoreductase [Candidatus Auribacterota bacterium]